jgi:hypothetical protein
LLQQLPLLNLPAVALPTVLQLSRQLAELHLIALPGQQVLAQQLPLDFLQVLTMSQ